MKSTTRPNDANATRQSDGCPGRSAAAALMMMAMVMVMLLIFRTHAFLWHVCVFHARDWTEIELRQMPSVVFRCRRMLCTIKSWVSIR